MEFGKAQILLGKLDDGLATLDRVLQTSADEDPRDFDFIIDVETRMANVMRTLGRIDEADEIVRRLASVSELLTEADAAEPSDT